MWSEATRNIVRGLMGAGSLAASTLGSSLGFATLAALGGAGVGGGVGGSSMMRVLGFLGALSLAPAGLPRFLGSEIASSAGACSAIVGSFSETCSLCSELSATSIQRKKRSSFYLIVRTIDHLERLVKRS